MKEKMPGPILGTIKIVGLYLLIGFLWILFSDQLANLFAANKNVFHQISIYKGWGYVLVTGIFLYFLIKNHTDQIGAREAWLRMAYDATDMGTWQHNLATGIFRFDERTRVHHGFDEGVYAAPFSEVLTHVHPDDFLQLKEGITKATNPASNGYYSSEFRTIHQDGSIHWLKVEASVSFEGVGENRRPVLGVGTTRDITKSKRADLQIRYFARLYAALSQVNQTIVRCNEPLELFTSICNVAVEYGEFRLAWIGLLDEETDSLVSAAEQGFGDNKFPFQKMDLHKLPFRDDLVGMALRSSRVEICNDIQVEPHMTHWQEIAIRDNYHSAAAIPIRQNARVIGLLILLAADTDFFMVIEEQKLLEEMGLDISFALDTMQLEIERSHTVDALRKSEKKYSVLFEKAAIPASLSKLPEVTFVDVNEAFEKMLGYDKEEVIGKTSLELGIARPEEHKRTVAEVEKKGSDINAEKTIFTKSGEARIITANVNLVEIGDQQYALTTLQDITERKQAERHLLESEERFHKAFWSGPVGLAITRASDGVYLEANVAFSEITGFSREDLLDKTSLGLGITTPEQRKEYARLMSEQGFIRDQEMVLRHRSGTMRIVLGSMEIVVLNDETCVLSTAIDITERKQAEDALRKSDERWASLVKTMPDIIALFDADGKYQFLNRYADGYSEKDVIGRQNIDFIMDEYKAVYLEMFEKAKQTGRTQYLEYEAYGDFGSVRYYDSYFTPAFEDGRFVYMLVLARDITERKAIEKDLQTSEERFRQLVNNIEEVFWIFDPIAKKEVYISPAFEKIWMRPVETFFDDPDLFFESILLEDREHVREVTGRQAQGEKTEVQYRISRPDGSIRWIWDRGFPVFDESGNVVRIVAILSDISEQKQAELDLLELNQTLEQRINERTAEVQDLYENAPAGYHSIDVNGMIVRMNQTELNWLGYTREEVVEVKRFTDLVNAESKKIFSETFFRFKELGKVNDLEFEMIRKDGSIMPILLNATAIYNERGEFSMSRSTLFDITERKQIELKMQAANLALEKAAKLKDEFLANMSHELRTPLNAIIGLSESLQIGTYGELAARQEKILHVIRESGQHLLQLINDILDLSKIEAGMSELQREAVDVRDLCESSLLLVNESAQKKELQVSISITDEIQTIYADKRRLKQMIVNLLSNAIKFTPQYGRMGLKVLPENDHAIRFNIWDTGIGISAEQLENLFKPFVQVDSSLSRKYEGTGLGLALVRQLAEMHNGSIGVDSTPGKGSSFYFIIPKQSSQGFTDETLPVSGEIPLEPIAFSTSAFTILLVEDNPTNMMFTGDYLAAKGFNLITAENGLQAIEQAEIHKPNLILMDIQMPELDGLETIRRLRSTPEFASVPIIALTALAMPGDREHCLEAGANEYLTKPVSLKKLFGVIAELLR